MYVKIYQIPRGVDVADCEWLVLGKAGRGSSENMEM